MGATVSNCDTAANGFIKCEYSGETGYILASYLDQWLEPNPGLEESARLDDMQVTNCNEWVSLRSGPGSSMQQIAKVPLGTVLTDCYEAENGYIWVNYNGQGGYISAQYLKPYEDNLEPNTCLLYTSALLAAEHGAQDLPEGVSRAADGDRHQRQRRHQEQPKQPDARCV